MLTIARMMVAIGLAATALPASAAEFRSGKAGGVPVVIVAGALNYGDGERFERISASLPKNTTVAFESMGGNLLAGLKIGETIRARGYGTLVPTGSTCASACAIAWLGGTRRYLASGARLGFHAASGSEGVSAPGNALVGAYMARLGLKQDAVYALTAASPYDIAWLDFASARTLGIAVEPYSGPAFGGGAAVASNRVAPRTPSYGAPTYPSYSAAPRYVAPVPVTSRSDTSRGCPAYTYGGHGGCAARR